MMSKLSLFGIVGCLTFLFAACGGSSDSGGSADCGKLQPCGGNPVGTWKLVDTCVDTAAVNDQVKSMLPATVTCDGLTVKSADATGTGSMTFNADMSYSTSTTSTITMTVFVPTACLTVGPLTLTCDQLGASLGGSAAQFESFKCVESTGGCNCNAVTKPETAAETGTYSVDGVNLTVSPSNGDPDTSEFCVKGSEIHIIQRNDAKTAIVADIVGRK
ncbi:MAG: hypothetical protein QM756_39450 [Polyangiaceae bacterium]